MRIPVSKVDLVPEATLLSSFGWRRVTNSPRFMERAPRVEWQVSGRIPGTEDIVLDVLGKNNLLWSTVWPQ